MFAALVGLALVASSADAKEKELSESGKKELKALQGVWKATKLVRGEVEEENPKEGGNDVFIEFKDRTLLLNDKEFLTITGLDPSTDPKIIDFKALIDRGPVSKDTVFEGIYKLDGDTLTLALNIEGGTNRPAKFETGKDPKITIVTFAREKK